ncbi:MAG TPA: Crp/Fnr family transcriptional regulator [Candidatus Limnocylindria bacterium]|nr:Crp/Fnr family transcriptional regulator [Candidatus Limnocylindria bacterium]
MRLITVHEPATNAVLASFPAAELDTLRPHLRRVELRREQEIYAPHAIIREIYFPIAGLISMVAQLRSGEQAEVGVIGRQGMSGLPVYAGARNLGFRTAVQIPGEALVLDAELLVRAQDRSSALRRAIEIATSAHIALIAQTAACNRAHDVEQRLARWLLVSRDAADGAELELTQEYLAMMIGVQRPTVTLAAGTFQRDGLMDYRRGKIRIRDAAALEARSCECYEIVRDEHRRLLDHDGHYMAALK